MAMARRELLSYTLFFEFAILRIAGERTRLTAWWFDSQTLQNLQK